MPVDRAARDTGGLRDVLERGAGHAALAEELLGRIQYCVARLLSLVLRASYHFPVLLCPMRNGGRKMTACRARQATCFLVRIGSLHTYTIVCNIASHRNCQGCRVL